MEYRLKIGDETIPVEVETGKDKLLFHLSGNACDVEYTFIDSHQLSLSVNGKRINAWVMAEKNGTSVFINGRTYFIEDEAASELMKKTAGKGTALPDKVTPPMPAIVIEIPVGPGDSVEKGQGVIVVSAMKMETTLFAPYSGTVSAVNTAVGEKVNPGDILVDIVNEAGTA